uniref:Putative Xylosyltransferase 1 n=1 Tax=Aegilops tauschii TaxID=37682 RepID=M8ARJ9_AEGTA
MVAAGLPPIKHHPAESQPCFATMDIDIGTPSSSPRGRSSSCAGIDLRVLLSVVFGGIFTVFLLAASQAALPSASLFLQRYSAATQRPSPPRFAYLVSGSKGDAGRLRRCLLALYHPRNRYILHLDAEAPDSDRAELAAFVAAHPVLVAAGNVRVVEKANLVTYRGITMVTTTLHAAAAFLHGSGAADWDWFINLSASDYPLVTQDDLMDVFSRLPRDLNFIEHTSDMGWKAHARAKPLVVDPGLYVKTKRDLMWMNTETEKRELPTAFTLFTDTSQTTSSVRRLSIISLLYARSSTTDKGRKSSRLLRHLHRAIPNGRPFWPDFVPLGRRWVRPCPPLSVGSCVRPPRGRTPNLVRVGCV